MTTGRLTPLPAGRRGPGRLPRAAPRCVGGGRLQVAWGRRGRGHWHLQVADGSEVVVVEIIGGWSAPAEAPRAIPLGDAILRVDSPHEILVRKLMALFDRAEPRDLLDIHALLDAGGELDRALADAGRQFSGLTRAGIAGVLRSLPLRSLASTSGWNLQETDAMVAFREKLLGWLIPRGGEEG